LRSDISRVVYTTPWSGQEYSNMTLALTLN